ncbi:hypothetical protein PMAYCL1PPCAC_27470, partial [Pristionchus mayeri]
FVQAVGLLTLMDTQKTECHIDLPETPSWESLAWPAVDRICLHLFNREDCGDLANLAKVSTHYHDGVYNFMKKNRPGVYMVDLQSIDSALVVYIGLYPSKLPFYGLTTLDRGRFERNSSSLLPCLRVKLNDTEDPIIDQVSSLLCSSIKDVEIHGYRFFPVDLSLCTQLIHGSTIGYLEIRDIQLNHGSASNIISIASRAKEFALYNLHKLQLSDTAAFITQLASMD